MKKPDWKVWLDREKVMEVEACALSLDIDPHCVKWCRVEDGLELSAQPAQQGDTLTPAIKKELDKRCRLMQEDVDCNSGFLPREQLNGWPIRLSGVALDSFAAWCELKKLDIPAQLVRLSESYGGAKRLQEEAAKRRRLALADWWASSMDAITWWKQDSVKFDDAAKLLFGVNPREIERMRAQGRVVHDAGELLTVDDDTATDGKNRTLTQADYLRLRDAFDAKQHTSQDRTLAYWLELAQQKGLQYHGWIDLCLRTGVIVAERAGEWLKFANKKELDAFDLYKLVLWRQVPLVLGDHDDEITFTKEAISPHRYLTDPHALALRSPEEKAVITKFASDCRLPLPCTPLELVEWRDRMNASEGGAELVALPDEFVRAVQEAVALEKTSLAESELGSESSAKRARPQQQQRFQESEILRVITELGHTAKALPRFKQGKPGVKAAVREKLSFSVGVFDKAWERLAANCKIAYSKE
jgi:hypothetical protein